MRLLRPLLGAVLCVVTLIVGCQDGKPLGPSRVVSLNVSIPSTAELRSSLFNSGSNKLLYRVAGTDMTPVMGTLGPFSTANAYGAVEFSLDIPGGGSKILSVQINDAGTNAPLALGAASIDFASSSPVSTVFVEMGSLTRNCYYVSYASTGWGYNFTTDTMGATFTGDMASIVAPGIGVPATLFDPNFVTPANSIAYMGNGDLVNFDRVPPISDFRSSSLLAKPSGPLQIGDVFCIKLLSTLGGHAWIQITDPGLGSMYRAAFFRFRLNKTKPYYAYDRTQPDVSSACASFW